MTAEAVRSLGRAVTQFLLVLAGSLVAGWLIGTAQHYIAWGVWYTYPGDDPILGSRFGLEALRFAEFEGGTAGIMAALPTGFIAWYVILRRHATVSEVRKIVLVTLAGGCALAACFGLASARMTPFLTGIIAANTAGRRLARPDHVPMGNAARHGGFD